VGELFAWVGDLYRGEGRFAFLLHTAAALTVGLVVF
jgi:hypothetical protein